MKVFLIITLTIIAVIMCLTLILAGFLFNDKAKRKIRFTVAAVDLILIALSAAAFLMRDKIPSDAISFLGNAATIIFASQLICIGLVLAALIIRKIYRLLNKPLPFNRERRKMLAYSLFYPLMSFTTTVYANQIERNNTVDNHFDIKIKDLPEELSGFTLAQISDVHLGAYFSLERLKLLLDRIANSKPDILAITGDIFDDNSINAEAIKLVDSYSGKFKYGIYYCHGNHEHHRGIKAIEQGLSQTQIHWLVNQSGEVPIKSPRPLYILGVDYPMGAPITQSREPAVESKFNHMKKEFINQARKEVPDNAICILLAHHPEFIDDAAEIKIPLTLTGHTHGSQIGIFGVPLFPIFKYTRGMVRINDCYGYVHVGNGSWFPFRLGCPPEIAYFTLSGDK